MSISKARRAFTDADNDVSGATMKAQQKSVKSDIHLIED
jgi:hypothetical protein